MEAASTDLTELPSIRDRVARRIYRLTGTAENDPWEAVMERRARLGLNGHNAGVALAYAQADAVLDELGLAEPGQGDRCTSSGA